MASGISGRTVAVLLLFLGLAGCKNAIPQVSSAPPSNAQNPRVVHTTTTSNFGAASGMMYDGSRKIKFNIGYNATGSSFSDGPNQITPTSAGVNLER